MRTSERGVKRGQHKKPAAGLSFRVSFHPSGGAERTAQQDVSYHSTLFSTREIVGIRRRPPLLPKTDLSCFRLSGRTLQLCIGQLQPGSRLETRGLG